MFSNFMADDVNVKQNILFFAYYIVYNYYVSCHRKWSIVLDAGIYIYIFEMVPNPAKANFVMQSCSNMTLW